MERCHFHLDDEHGKQRGEPLPLGTSYPIHNLFSQQHLSTSGTTAPSSARSRQDAGRSIKSAWNPHLQLLPADLNQGQHMISLPGITATGPIAADCHACPHRQVSGLMLDPMGGNTGTATPGIFMSPPPRHSPSHMADRLVRPIHANNGRPEEVVTNSRPSSFGESPTTKNMRSPPTTVSGRDGEGLGYTSARASILVQPNTIQINNSVGHLSPRTKEALIAERFPLRIYLVPSERVVGYTCLNAEQLSQHLHRAYLVESADLEL
ncbi:hypothetical protein PGT21_021527 [Puccinia graminis f. sp. tritici]|uniref:Uncharacterized protein n=2 Tax=Puccinia graminis f. sp. tritici TaxID=56615 RepID=A0A5B0QBF0_PUCGR|nr:hypothetical protein PGT21_021527 [Puccinia graminis f. sp. tritici]